MVPLSNAWKVNFPLPQARRLLLLLAIADPNSLEPRRGQRLAVRLLPMT